jgi:hypothetical protein
MLAFRSVQQSNHCAREEFLYELKAGPAGGRLRRPSSAGRATLGASGLIREPGHTCNSSADPNGRLLLVAVGAILPSLFRRRPLKRTSVASTL